jgi:2-dehydro-3-deoxygluconokinase
MSSVICFGEILLRFSPFPNDESFALQQMPVFIGGAELNVAQALAKWNIAVDYCTAMPDNFLTQSILGFIAKKGIGTNAVYKGGERMGVYYLQQGTDVKNDTVVFDRANSSFATLQPGQINWTTILKDKKWFHCSAIAASLSQSAAEVCLEAIKAARQLGITVSLDLNYRSKLWKYGKQPTEIMPALIKHCDVVMGNIWSVENLLGLPSPVNSSEGKTNEELVAAAQQSMAALQTSYPNIHTIAYTFRLAENYFAILSNDNKTYKSSIHQLQNVIDKVGSGDCFMAGLIHGFSNEESPQHIINFAASAAVGKLYEKGDNTQQSVAQIKSRYLL